MFKDEQYQKILDGYLSFKTAYEKKKQEGIYTQAYLSDYAQKFQEAIRNDLKNFYDSKLQAIKDQQAAVKAKYAVKYDNPQEEILRRQDIERKVKVMSDLDLKDAVTNLRNDTVKDSYYYDMLQIEANNRGMKEEASSVGGYRAGHKVDTPWEADEEYTSTFKEEALVNQVKNSTYMWSGEGEDRVFYDVSQL